MALLTAEAMRFPPTWVDMEDYLCLAAWNSVANLKLSVQGRIMRISGAVERVGFTLTPMTNRDQSTKGQRMGAGWLLSVLVYPTDAVPRRGQTFAMVYITRGGVEATDRAMILVKDYIATVEGISWPGGRQIHSVESTGLLRSVTGTDPAAGAEISETVPTNARWSLKALYFSLVTDATVADRQVRLLIDDGTNTLDTYIMTNTQLASLTRYYVFTHIFATETLTGSYLMTGLNRPIDLFQDWRIRTSTINLKAGDNFGAPQLLVEEWIEE